MEDRSRNLLIRWLYPRRCPVCHDLVSARGALICPECRDGFAPVEEPVCLRCGRTLAAAEEEYCPDCQGRPETFAASVAAFYYNAAAMDSIMKFKYSGRREYADYYVAALMERQGARIQSWRPQLVLPVPIHKSRRRERGFNQAAELARRLARELSVPMREDILVRPRRTEDQKHLNAAARQENLRHAFAVTRPLTGIESVLLVDDIYTTGSTMAACARALREAGAAKVYGTVIFIGGA